ncbi:MAG TPA: hypothetical protein VFF69_15590 [Phycisphaerales bacterium]|nr:hypothetical protein [Phycisphaerales bacterium]
MSSTSEPTTPATAPGADPVANPDAPGAAPAPADADDTGALPAAAGAALESDTAHALLADRLASVEAAAADLRRMLERSERDRAIDRELLACGVIDLESARAVVEERLGAGSTIPEAVAWLRERRPMLFASRTPPLRATTAAPGADRGAAPLHEVAHAARETGDRRLLLDYLRLRRAEARA